jgi:hypothetical protein
VAHLGCQFPQRDLRNGGEQRPRQRLPALRTDEPAQCAQTRLSFRGDFRCRDRASGYRPQAPKPASGGFLRLHLHRVQPACGRPSPGGDPRPPGRVLARHDARDAASAGLGLAPFRPVRRLCSTPRRLMMRPSRTGHAQDKRGFQTGDKQRGDLMLMNIFAVVPAYAGTTLSRWPRIAEVWRLHTVTTSGPPNERINLGARHLSALRSVRAS